MNTTIEIGYTYEVPYPFIRVNAFLPDDGRSISAEGWAPGVVLDMHHYNPDMDCRVAKAMGTMLLTVIGVYKPGTYPCRVFYTRRWRAPDGREFGKKHLLVATTRKFQGMLHGYRYSFEVES